MKKDTFSPSMLSGVKLTDDGQEIILKSSTAGNFIVKKKNIREVLLSSGTGMLGGDKAIIIINGEQGELVRSGNLKFDHAKSIKDWIESRINTTDSNTSDVSGSSSTTSVTAIASTSETVSAGISNKEKNEMKKKSGKGCLLGCGGLILVFFLFMVGSCMSDSKSKTSTDPGNAKIGTPTVENKTTTDSPVLKQRAQNIDRIQKGIEGTKEEAENIYLVLREVGATEVDSFEGTIKSGFMFSSEKDIGKAVMPVYLNDNKSVRKIVFKNVTLYENGKAMNGINSGIATEAEKQKAMSYAEEVVRANLKAPSSAKFPGSYHVFKNNDVIEVVGYVDSQNSFGAMIRSKFFVKFDKNFKPIDLKIESN